MSTHERGCETEQELVRMSKRACGMRVSECKDASVCIHTGEHASEHKHAQA